ncbi:hypothetical protein ACQ4LE_004390 [Meloidogyne hapla]
MLPMRSKKIKIPNDLLLEIINSIRFHQKWENIRISKLFDLLVIKFQKNFIINLKIELRIKKLQIRIAIQKVYDFLFDVYKKEKDLKIPYLIQNAGHYDGILQNLLDFSAEIPSFARVNERCKSTELVYEKAWPAKRTTNLLDGGLWNTENETKNRILERLFYPLCQIVDDLDSETLLGVYEKTLQFVKDQISTLRTLHGVQETTEGPTAKRARTTEEGSSSAGTSKN